MIILVLAVVGVVLFDVAFRPTLRRLATRNMARRRGEALLVIAGGLLGTAIIAASFIVGDTINESIRDGARTRLGPVDHVVRSQVTGQADAVARALASDPVPATDGVLRIDAAPAVAASIGSDRRADPNVSLVELDFDAGRSFGGDPAGTGLATAGATPVGDEAVLNDQLAAELRVGKGDRIEVFAYGSSRQLTVRDVIPELGLAGYGPVGLPMRRESSQPLFVAPGTVASMAATSTVPFATPPTEIVAVSAEGGVFGDPAQLRVVADVLESRVAGMGELEVVAIKADLLEMAKTQGDSIGQLYVGIGGFSVIAGVLLLVNLFVMLAEERKTELGMLRALGFKRNHVVRAFAIEGAIYSVAAAAAGAIVGIGVGAVITHIAQSIFTSDGGDLAYRFTVKPGTLLGAAVAGLVISMVTVWATSIRIARLNVIRAIRDLPDPTDRIRRVRSLVFGVLGMALGAGMLLGGIGGKVPVLALAGPAVACFSAIPVLGWFLPRKPAVIALSSAALVWVVSVFQLLPETMETVSIESFLVQGVLTVGAAIMILQQFDRVWARISDGLSVAGRGLAARLGLAYPLARRFRTGMLLGMYSLVIFTMTFLATFSDLFAQQEPSITRSVSAGYDIIVDTNPANPVATDELAARAEVTAVAPVLRSFPEWTTAARPERSSWPVAGVDERLFERGSPRLSKRLPELPDDEAALRTVLTDPTTTIVPDFFLQQGGGPPEAVIDVGDEVKMYNPVTGREHTARVIGVATDDWVFNGPFMAREFVRDFMAPAVFENRHYVAINGAANPDDVATLLDAELVQNGSDARSFRREVRVQLSQQRAFFALMNGYLGLGLVIGIAGLGVVMVRAVRERRRQIGMLRAMGFSSRVVRASFLLEAAFIALQGSLLGIGLGLLCAYQVLVNTDVFGNEMPFQVPWTTLATIFAVPFVASLVAAAAPATQAARIRPAVALRIAD